MNHTFRLNRIRTPRGTIAAIALLVVFFIVFGVLLAGVAIVEHAAMGPRHVGSAATALVHWMFGTGELA